MVLVTAASSLSVVGVAMAGLWATIVRDGGASGEAASATTVPAAPSRRRRVICDVANDTTDSAMTIVTGLNLSGRR